MNYLYSKTLQAKSEIANSLLIFFISPIAGLYISFRDYKQSWAKNIFWLFCIFFGFTFIISEFGGSDSDRYARRFIELAHSDLTLGELWNSFYSEDSNYVDIVTPLISYLVSLVTDNPTILFTIFGLIFGYFYSRNIWYVLDRTTGNYTGLILLFISTYILLDPIWNINGFRMNTAAQVFLFGALPYLMEGNYKRLIWAGASMLVHFSFMLPIAILLLFILLRNRTHIFMVFFIVTSFINEIDLLGVQSTLSFLPDIFNSKVEQYARPEYVENLSDRLADNPWNWYVPMSIDGIKWIVYAAASFIYLFGRKILKERKDLTTLFCFSLLLYGFANIASFIPSGGRFIMVANTFMFAFFILVITNFPDIKGLRFIEFLSAPLLILFCLVSVRIGMDFFGLMTIVGNPLVALFYRDTIPLIDIIKGM
jgi:hypothetical protein